MLHQPGRDQGTQSLALVLSVAKQVEQPQRGDRSRGCAWLLFLTPCSQAVTSLR